VLKIPARIIGHEAAHAVVAHHVGVRVVELSITPVGQKASDDPTCIAHGCVTTTFHGGDVDGFLRKLEAGKATCDEALGMMTVFLAGPVAQGSGVGGASDRGKAEAIAYAYASGDERAARALIGIARHRAASLVRKYRPLITKLSHTLKEKQTLRGAALQHILRAAA
jgi:hypothetical protein